LGADFHIRSDKMLSEANVGLRHRIRKTISNLETKMKNFQLLAFAFVFMGAIHLQWAVSQDSYYAVSVAPVSQEPISTIHALLIIDTDAHNAEKLGIPLDGAKMQDWLLECCTQRNLPLDLRLLAEKDCNPKRIFDEIERMQSSPNDIVIVYYSGHAATSVSGYRNFKHFDHYQKRFVLDADRDRGTSGHFLALNSGPVFRGELIEAMMKKPARLGILLTDCCSGFIDADLTSGKSAGYATIDQHRRNGALKAPPANLRNFDDLFLNRFGFLNITARLPGDNAGGDSIHGGHFTFGFLKALSGRTISSTPQDGLASNWDGILMNVTDICEARFPDSIQESGVDVQSSFRDGIAVALNPELFENKNLGLSVNGSEWKVYSSNTASGNLQLGMYNVYECTIDGVPFMLDRRKKSFNKEFWTAMSHGRSIDFQAQRINISGDSRKQERFKAQIRRSDNKVIRTAETITRFRYRFTWELQNGTTLTRVFEGGDDFDAVRLAAERQVVGIRELIGMEQIE